MDTKFLLRKSTGDQKIAADAELQELLRTGGCLPSDSLFELSTKQWCRAGDHSAASGFFAEKPSLIPDRRVIYFLAPGGAASAPLGPFSTKEIQARAQAREVCGSTWIFVEGDKEWRQIRNVKILNEMLAPLPAEAPPTFASPAFAPAAPVPPAFQPSPTAGIVTPDRESPSMPSIKLDMSGGSGRTLEPDFEREEITVALDTMGLNLHSVHATLPPASPPTPPKIPRPAASPPGPPPGVPAARGAKAPAPAPASAGRDSDSFDGIVAEIPSDPIWMVKLSAEESVSGPYRFLEVVRMIEEGKLTKNDKIARTGTKAFVKIHQQYEFNVKYSLETVVENGHETQKILIRRRHPRVPYITGVQVSGKHGNLVGQCVNISAGGILLELPKAEFLLGDIIEVKVLPGLIPKAIACRSLVIGKIPKIPPAFALKFEDLKNEDKEAIEYYVQESMKREMSKKT